MPALPLSIIPPSFAEILVPFAPHSSSRVWRHALVLVAGVLLTPARRTVTAALQVLGLGELRQYQCYHRALSHARWSGLAVSRALARLLVAPFAPTGPLVFGIDETLERRRGQRIAAQGTYRGSARAGRISSRPAACAGSARYCSSRSRGPAAAERSRCSRRWPRPRGTTASTAAAVWYHSGPPPVRLRWALIRDPRGAFEPQALLCTDPATPAERILAWFVQRWQLEVACEETRRHLGLETQRQWSDAAIRPDDPRAPRPVLAGHAARPRTLRDGNDPRSARRLVSQGPAHLRRRSGTRPP